jgi:hypothetical protein
VLREDGLLGQGLQNTKEKKAQAHLAQVDDDEPTLLMATFCALHNVVTSSQSQRQRRWRQLRSRGRHHRPSTLTSRACTQGHRVGSGME